MTDHEEPRPTLEPEKDQKGFRTLKLRYQTQDAALALESQKLYRFNRFAEIYQSLSERKSRMSSGERIFFIIIKIEVLGRYFRKILLKIRKILYCRKLRHFTKKK